uniref:Uncharacterized protein n=1 Tax=Anguilla anguilla TaxID=7936 RepID=A0A0E9X073_ANGAN
MRTQHSVKSTTCKNLTLHKPKKRTPYKIYKQSRLKPNLFHTHKQRIGEVNSFENWNFRDKLNSSTTENTCANKSCILPKMDSNHQILFTVVKRTGQNIQI